jgi:hypothetical protein
MYLLEGQCNGRASESGTLHVFNFDLSALMIRTRARTESKIARRI